MKKIIVSKMDEKHLSMLRDNVKEFLKMASIKYDAANVKLLDIAPQIHKGAAEFFKNSTIFTLDIDKNSKADFIADLCNDNSEIISDGFFDIIVCTEVLEHTLNPFDAVREIWRMLKNEGIALISVPFNFRIHGPLPDCWRFTEHGLKELFKKFSKIEILSLDTEDRDLMPIHYTLIAEK